MTTCSPEYVEELLKPVKEVTRWDLEGLMRMYSDDELVELWNEIKHSMRRYLRECSSGTSEKLDKYYRGLFQLAQLLIAASFRSREIEKPGITDRFRDEEYEVILDFEKYKIFDSLSIDQIVEFIERREGKVYEFVREYYAKQYNALDRVWANLLRDMMAVIENRYRRRREKIEEAVVEYIRRRGLLGTVLEIEEAVKKALEAGEIRREAVKDISSIEAGEERLLEEIMSLREEVRKALTSPAVEADYSGLFERYGELEETVYSIASRLRGLLEKLGIKYNELSSLEYSGSSREIIDAEINALARVIDDLRSRLREYEGLIKSIEAEREALRARVEELREALAGVEEGAIVSIDEACGLIQSYLSRIWSKVSGSPEIYDPLSGKKVRVKSWSDRVILGGDPCNTGIIMTLVKGLISKRRRLVVEVRAVAHWDVLREKGFDSRRVGLSEILSIVSDRVRDAVSDGYYHILVIASPTGFTSKAVEFVSGDYHKRFASRNLTLYLVDLLSGKLYYNELDSISTANRWVAEPEYRHEAIKKIMDYVLSEEALIEANRRGLPPHLPIDYIVEATGESREYVRIALEKLAGMGKGRVSRLRSGDIVFIYRV